MEGRWGGQVGEVHFDGFFPITSSKRASRINLEKEAVSREWEGNVVFGPRDELLQRRTHLYLHGRP